MKLPLITAALRQSFPPRGSLIYFLVLSLPLGGKVLNVSEADEGHSIFFEARFLFSEYFKHKSFENKEAGTFSNYFFF